MEKTFVKINGKYYNTSLVETVQLIEYKEKMMFACELEISLPSGKRIEVFETITEGREALKLLIS